jgi:hypothetical protein
MKPSLVPIVAAAAMLSVELAEGFTAPASLAAAQLRTHSMQVRAAAAADSSQYLVDYMVRAQDEKLKAIESTKAAVAQEYEARLAAMEARLQQLSAGAQPKAAVAAVAAPAAAAPAAAAPAAAPVKSASQAVGYAPAGPEKRIEDYRAEMAEFLLTVQRERLQSMDTLRRELSTAYDEQVADVQAQIAQLNAPAASAVAAPAKPVAAVAAPQAHPAYAARQQRQGWSDRWGDSETARLGVPQAAAAPVVSAVAAPAPAAAVAVAPQKQQSNVHPAYAARLTRQGWQDRWGASETLRITAEAITSVDSSTTAAALPANVHPAYAARLQRADWGARWGSEEALRVSAVADSLTAAATSTSAVSSSGDVVEVTRQLEELRSYLQQYIARSGEERSKLKGQLDAAASRAEDATVQLHAVRASYEAYAASSLEHRTAAVTAAREAALREAAAAVSADGGSSKVNGSSSSSGSGSAAAPVMAAAAAAPAAAVAAVPLNAAYVARNSRPGLSSRWGAEELQRVAAASK